MTNFKFPKQTAFYKGKVRDVYTIDNKLLVMVASDRISAFDVILPRPIPYKGQVLNQIAAYSCEPFKIEMVVRGNLTGHAWRIYNAGKRELCGVPLPDGMKENDFFASPIITPSTKAEQGHDEDISAEQIIARGLATKKEWEILCNYTLQLFERGKEIAAKRGLILVDTKYEFGKIGNDIYLMDEVHTPDSSRYFYADGFEERQKKGGRQKQLSKEFVREWLIANDFMGKEGQVIPEMSDEWVQTISKRYIELYEKVIGEKFIPQNLSDEEIYKRIIESLQRLEVI